MPGMHIGKFLRKHIFSEIEVDSENVSLASIMAMDPLASRILRAAIKRIEKPKYIASLFSCLFPKIANSDRKLGLVGAILSEQYGVLCDLAELCLRCPSEEYQRLFLKVL